MGPRNVSRIGMAVMGHMYALGCDRCPRTMKKTIGNNMPNRSNIPDPSFCNRFFSDYRLPHFYFLHKIFQKTFLCVRSFPAATASNVESRRQTARGFSKEYV